MLDEPGDQRRSGHDYRLDRVDGKVLLRQDGRPQYLFALAPREMHQFEGMCRALQTPPSYFTESPICSRITPDGRISLAGMRLITTAGEERSERDLADAAERREVLLDLFGIDLGGAEL
jgi:N-hydroxyarylamine O-acetyltransferase